MSCISRLSLSLPQRTSLIPSFLWSQLNPKSMALHCPKSMALYHPSAIPSEPHTSSFSSLCRRRKYQYDVYLSFSRNDTCKNFADPIYKAMKAAGINIFRYDKELRVGETFSEKLLEPIECSRISVIIFSKDYAASSWCLEEVKKIIECWKTFQQPVLSIFYMVDLDSLVEAFAKHQGHFAADNMSRWREALTEAVYLPGFKCRNGNGEETEWIQKFLKDILATLGALLLNERRDDGANGRRIGQLFVSDKEIAKGSNGTIVFEGNYSGRVVAVKRLLKTRHDVAFREIQIHIESDRHQRIVRFYGEENDRDFVYLALQLCTCSLADLIQIYSYHSQNTPFSDEYNVRLDSVKHIMGDIKLWKASGRPSPLLLELMRDVVSGLVHLHELGIIHGDLQPQNVLINIEEKSLRAKLSDMGISKPLHPGQSYFSTQATVCGSLGWRAPEQILGGRQTRALDLFSLGCVLFFCITGGIHPFGDDHFERDSNIRKNHQHQVAVSAVKEYIPEAADLFSQLLDPHLELRPKALQVLHHPLFWNSEMRLSFVRDTSDRVELEAKETNSNLLKALENIKPLTFGAQWNTEMDPAFIANIGLRRGYKFDSVRDLLRVMRNKLNHYMELPKDIKEMLGPVPEGFDDYFASRFPKLLIEVYKVVSQYCKEEKWCEKYLKCNV